MDVGEEAAQLYMHCGKLFACRFLSMNYTDKQYTDNSTGSQTVLSYWIHTF